MIYRLIDTGIGIEIGSEFHADCLTPRHDAKAFSLSGEIFSTIECHVLQKMGEASLAWFFQNGAYSLCDIEIGETRFFGIMPDIVSHAIFKFTHFDCWVLWHLLRRQGDGQQEKEGEK